MAARPGASVLARLVFSPEAASAQVPPRFYWKTLSGANAVPLIVNSISGNTNPFDPSHLVTPGANVDATLALPGYARTFSLVGRAALFAVIAPMGRISGEVTAGAGRPPLRPPRVRRPDARVRPQPRRPAGAEEPCRRLALRAGVLLRPDRRPCGAGRRVRQHPDAEPRPEPLVRRWARPSSGSSAGGCRAGARPGAPARRVALRDQRRLRRADAQHRSDVPGGRAPDARLHRALLGLARRRLVHGRKGDDRRRPGGSSTTWAIGLTLGYQINDNLGLTVGYKSTINDSAPGDLQMDGFMVSSCPGWHPLVEGARRLKGE